MKIRGALKKKVLEARKHIVDVLVSKNQSAENQKKLILAYEAFCDILDGKVLPTIRFSDDYHGNGNI